jgi:hypothetical protein
MLEMRISIYVIGLLCTRRLTMQPDTRCKDTPIMHYKWALQLAEGDLCERHYNQFKTIAGILPNQGIEFTPLAEGVEHHCSQWEREENI